VYATDHILHRTNGDHIAVRIADDSNSISFQPEIIFQQRMADGGGRDAAVRNFLQRLSSCAMPPPEPTSVKSGTTITG
jgi:hypothetical protein